MGRNHHSTAAEQCLQVRQNQSFWASHPASRVWWGYQWDDLHFLEWIFWGYRLSKLAWKVDFCQNLNSPRTIFTWIFGLNVWKWILQSCRYWGVSSEHFILYLGVIWWGWTGQEKCSDKGGALSSFTRVVHIVVGWQLNPACKRKLLCCSPDRSLMLWVRPKVSIHENPLCITNSPTRIVHLLSIYYRGNLSVWFDSWPAHRSLRRTMANNKCQERCCRARVSSICSLQKGVV